MRTTLAGLIMFIGCLLVIPAQARLVRIWSLDELTKAADVVAIIEPIPSGTRKTDDVLGEISPTICQGIETSFKVQVVLKGSVTGDTLTLLHGTPRSNSSIIVDGPPSFITFLTGPLAYEKKVSKDKEMIADSTYYQVKPYWLH